MVFFNVNMKSETKMEFPAIDPQKCKFADYGYRRLIELIIESEKFLKLIIEIKDISGFQMVELNHLIRGDDPTLRGIEALCNLIINQQVNYNPVCETDFKYLNVLLDSFTLPKNTRCLLCRANALYWTKVQYLSGLHCRINFSTLSGRFHF